jgi:hypothetical protein
VVELVLFAFRALTDAPFDVGIAYHDEVPRLQVGAAGRAAGGENALFDDLARHGAIGEMTDGAAPLHRLAELGGAPAHVVERMLFMQERNEARFGHD